MVYVSSKPLSKKVLKHIGGLLVAEIARAKTPAQAQAFSNALLTDTERIMLAKRFAIVVLLSEGASHRYIQRALKVSLSTIFRIQQLRKKGVFNNLITHAYRKPKARAKHCHNQETALEVLVRAGLPPMGKGRWRFLYKQTEHLQKGKRTK